MLTDGCRGVGCGLLASFRTCFSDFEGLGDFGMDAHKQLSHNNIILSDCVKNYLLEMEISNRSPGTLVNSRRFLQGLVDYVRNEGWPDVVGDIGREHLIEYLAYIKSRPSLKAKVKRPISDAYYCLWYRVIKAFFNWCLDRGYILENPLWKVPSPKVGKRVVSTVPAEDFKKLIRVTDPSLVHSPAKRFLAIRNQAILWMFYDTPARRNEIARLTTDHVDLAERRILVEGKGRKERYMYLGAVTVRAMTRYQSERSSLFPGTEDWWVDGRGYPFDRDDWLNSVLSGICARARVPRIHPHQFRHTFSITMIESDVPLPTLEVMGGWSKIPDTYLATLGDRAARAAHKRVSPADRLSGRR